MQVGKIIGACLLAYGLGGYLVAQEVHQDERLLGELPTTGYRFSTERPYKKVRLKWWKFLKRIGVVELHNDYWTISMQDELLLYSSITKSNRGHQSKVYLGLPSTHRSLDEYLDQIAELIVAFDVSMRKEGFEEQLEALKKEQNRKSKALNWLLKHQKYEPSDSTQAQIVQLEAEIDLLFDEQEQIIEQLAHLGEQNPGPGQ